ncbi:unnamed protein product [Trifolium pratense]|uniref:Uncharacterized protein n=2 Tax=Trifolium pratense TaxID=57577 RepID=A0ACB0LPT9_TRIPR|nr:unnamed protein product [Trifolium pratense]
MMNAPQPKSQRRKHSEDTQLLNIFLPHDVIIQILSFLPVKHLMRLKCVCKSWKTLISDDSTFVKLHLKRSARKKQLVLFSMMCRHSSNFSITCLRQKNPSVALANKPHFQLNDDVYGFLFPVGSCNGLLCLYGKYLRGNYAEILFYIWNPATRKLSNKIVFLCKPGTGRWTFAFGYDNSTETYKIVAFHLMTNDVRVFCVGDNVWRNIQSFPVVPTYSVPSLYKHWHPSIEQGVYVCRTLNWLTIRNKFQNENQIDGKCITADQFVIISLDLSTETYRELLPPCGFDEVSCVQPILAVLRNSLCFCHDFHGTDFIIWRMKKFGVQESWTQFVKINYQNLHNLVPHYHRFQLFPVCLCENGNTLMLAWDENEKAILYNWRDITVKESRITREVDWSLAKDYLESLVSIS